MAAKLLVYPQKALEQIVTYKAGLCVSGPGRERPTINAAGRAMAQAKLLQGQTGKGVPYEGYSIVIHESSPNLVDDFSSLDGKLRLYQDLEEHLSAAAKEGDEKAGNLLEDLQREFLLDPQTGAFVPLGYLLERRGIGRDYTINPESEVIVYLDGNNMHAFNRSEDKGEQWVDRMLALSGKGLIAAANAVRRRTPQQGTPVCVLGGRVVYINQRRARREEETQDPPDIALRVNGEKGDELVLHCFQGIPSKLVSYFMTVRILNSTYEVQFAELVRQGELECMPELVVAPWFSEDFLRKLGQSSLS